MARSKRSAPMIAILAMLGTFPLIGSAQTPKTVAGPPGAARTTLPPVTTRQPKEDGEVIFASPCPANFGAAGANPSATPVPNDRVFPPVPGGQSHLFTTIEQVRQYAVAHNDTFGELGFGGPDNGFVIASFVGDLTIHARALALLVDVPRGVIVCPAKFVGATMLALRNEILAQGVATQVDEFNGRAIVRIPADRRTAADALIAKYGHRILVMLGEFAYPDMNAETGLVPFPPCGELPVPSPRTKQLRWSTRPRSLQINSGGSLSADLTFTNVGYAPFSYNVDTTVGAVVTALGSNKIVARPLLYSILMATAGTLRQGQSSHVRGGATTASCDSRLGWALAPGRYELHFLLQHFSRAAGAETFMSTPIPLTIANGPPPPVRAHPDQSQITLPGIAP